MWNVYLGVPGRLATVLVPVLLLFSSHAAAAVSYAFTVIADTRDLFGSFSPTMPTLNSAGEVVFRAVLKAGGKGIFKGGSGQSLTLYDTRGDFSDFGTFIAFNNQGQVAFRAGSKIGRG